MDGDHDIIPFSVVSDQNHTPSVQCPHYFQSEHVHKYIVLIKTDEGQKETAIKS